MSGCEVESICVGCGFDRELTPKGECWRCEQNRLGAESMQSDVDAAYQRGYALGREQCAALDAQLNEIHRLLGEFGGDCPTAVGRVRVLCVEHGYRETDLERELGEARNVAARLVASVEMYWDELSEDIVAQIRRDEHHAAALRWREEGYGRDDD